MCKANFCWTSVALKYRNYLYYYFLPYILFFNIKDTTYCNLSCKNVQIIQKFLQILTEYSAASVWMQLYVKICWIKHLQTVSISPYPQLQLSPHCFSSFFLTFIIFSEHTKPGCATRPVLTVRGFGELLHSYCTDFRHICSSCAQSFVDNQMFHVRVFNQLIHQWVFILVAFSVRWVFFFFQEEFWQFILENGSSY